MSDAVAALVQQARAQRTHWLELDDPPRRALQWVEPGWEQQVRMLRGGMDLPRATVDCVTGWRGFVHADLAAGAADTPLPFSRDALELVLADHVDWVAALMTAVQQRIEARRAEIEAARGN